MYSTIDTLFFLVVVVCLLFYCKKNDYGSGGGDGSSGNRHACRLVYRMKMAIYASRIENLEEQQQKAFG